MYLASCPTCFETRFEEILQELLDLDISEVHTCDERHALIRMIDTN